MMIRLYKNGCVLYIHTTYRWTSWPNSLIVTGPMFIFRFDSGGGRLSVGRGRA